ncbi:MAG: glycosyltransferase [Planctomycetota bacterium]
MTLAAPQLSIVIPKYGRPEALTACLRSIAETVHAPYEIVCPCVASDTPTRDVLASFANLPLIEIVDDDRVGYVRATNRGFRASSGTWISHLNDDCIAMPHAIDNALRFVAPPVMREVGQVAYFHDTPVRRNIHAEITVEEIRYVVCHIRGLLFANFGMTRRDILECVGYYDERFFMYGADPDLSLKVWHIAKMRVEACPGALIRHLELTDERSAVERPAAHSDNERLFKKWDLATSENAPVAEVNLLEQKMPNETTNDLKQ